ncbi:hypothetical protein FRD01_13685 [Microvenator marinus]|uniref:Uncharacterized protein n=1 Tax=Microvenator marinus TaxID=2600177 RepID=A0A5B8XQT2_9DELT|nr:hypothetical protein [Microvenator marinus]QED28262.1 hypothetical protein FRD01_13685 [Microvenator marinus]
MKLYPEHAVTFGRVLIAYEGSSAYVAPLFYSNGGLHSHPTHTRWQPAPSYDLKDSCAKLIPMGDGALAYDVQGNAYQLDHNSASLVPHLSWNPAFARLRASEENRAHMEKMREMYPK